MKNNLLQIHNHKITTLRYGENPHQESYFYKNLSDPGIFDSIVQLGKKLADLHLNYENIKKHSLQINGEVEFDFKKITER